LGGGEEVRHLRSPIVVFRSAKERVFGFSKASRSELPRMRITDMHRHLFQHLVTSFEEALFKKYPDARRSPKVAQPRIQAVLYSLESAPKLHSFLLLQGNSNDERFTVELALARTPKFPWKADCDYDEKTCRSLPTFPVRARLGHLMGKNHDHWWETTSTLDPPLNASEKVMLKFLTMDVNDKTYPPDLVAKSVKSVFQNLQKFGLPFLQECAELQ
jgi:hypothetical protein